MRIVREQLIVLLRRHKSVDEAINTIERLPDEQLIAAVKSLAVHERCATARLVAALAEMERRRLYRGQGCSSLYAYCTQVLQLSEDAAYTRSHVARVGLRYPVVLRDLESGALGLTAIRLLEPFLTPENHSELLAAVRHKPKREVERFIAATWPDAANGEAALVTPIGADRYRVQFIASQALHDKLFYAQDLLRHAVPSGDLTEVIERAMDALVAGLERTKFAAVSHPRTPRRRRAGTRAVPAQVKRAVRVRDGGRCAFVGPEGRCRERRFLEFHHLVPFADGGAATLENIQLRCRAHNAYEAEEWFGAFGDEGDSSFRNG